MSWSLKAEATVKGPCTEERVELELSNDEIKEMMKAKIKEKYDDSADITIDRISTLHPVSF